MALVTLMSCATLAGKSGIRRLTRQLPRQLPLLPLCSLHAEASMKRAPKLCRQLRLLPRSTPFALQPATSIADYDLRNLRESFLMEPYMRRWGWEADVVEPRIFG